MRRRLAGWAFRRADPSDVPLLVRHRLGMFTEIGGRSPRQLRAHAAVYRRWLLPRLRSGEAILLLLETREHVVGASGGVWFRPEQPRPEAARLQVPYIFSMYTEPGFRRRGLAGQLVRELLRVSRSKGYRRVTLHAAPAARGIYRRAGFERTWEMRIHAHAPHGRKER